MGKSLEMINLFIQLFETLVMARSCNNLKLQFKNAVLDRLEFCFIGLDFFALVYSASGLFCCGRLCHWTFLLWEILLLDFLASGQMNRQAHGRMEIIDF